LGGWQASYGLPDQRQRRWCALCGKKVEGALSLRTLYQAEKGPREPPRTKEKKRAKPSKEGEGPRKRRAKTQTQHERKQDEAAKLSRADAKLAASETPENKKTFEEKYLGVGFMLQDGKLRVVTAVVWADKSWHLQHCACAVDSDACNGFRADVGRLREDDVEVLKISTRLSKMIKQFNVQLRGGATATADAQGDGDAQSSDGGSAEGGAAGSSSSSEVGTTGFKKTFSQADVPAVMCPVIPSAPPAAKRRSSARKASSSST
jgi:hypothetical protein